MFEVSSLDGQKYLTCTKLEPIILKLFLYSIIWRCSISSLPAFKNFKISENIEEEIRIFLNTNLELHPKSQARSLKTTDVPDYHIVLIKSEEKTNQLLAASNLGENAYMILMADFSLFFYTTEMPIVNGHEKFSNRQSEKSKIVIGNNEKWQLLTNMVVNRFL